MMVSNHCSAHGDWAPIYSLMARQGDSGIGGFKCVIKNSAKYIPFFGWGMYLLNWPFLKRKWDSDKEYLHRTLKGFAGDGVPVSLLVFPEGTKREQRAESFPSHVDLDSTRQH
jgi:1-acyl-sn-glycerol-3-phosphate acyltransferase